MIKPKNVWKMLKNLTSKTKAHEEHFLGATTKCMEDCWKPSLRHSPEHFVLHVRTNHFKSEECLKIITKFILNIAVSPKKENRAVSI